MATAVVIFIVTLFLLIKDAIKNTGEPVQKYRVLTLMVAVITAIILLLTWQVHPNNSEFRRKKELQDIANMQIVVDKIHSGEQLPIDSYSKYLIRFEGEMWHEDVYFYKVSYGKRHRYGYYKGYLYSEDDICDLYFTDVGVQYMRHIQDNWYDVWVN